MNLDDYDTVDELPAPPRKTIPEDDLQLLNLAARALGAVRVEIVEGEQWVNLHFDDGSTTFGWNPLRHSDDALNVMATLPIEVGYGRPDSADVIVSPSPSIYLSEWKGQDAAVATRRALTRAAAEIGKLRTP